MSRRRTGAAAALSLLLVLGVTACSGGVSADELAAHREDVIDVAREDIPEIVQALGGEIQESWGEYRSGGDGIVDRRFYTVTAVVTGSDADADALVAALEAAGWTNVVDNPNAGISGRRDGFTIGSTDPGGPELRLSVDGPYVKVADGVPRDHAREDLDLG